MTKGMANNRGDDREGEVGLDRRARRFPDIGKKSRDSSNAWNDFFHPSEEMTSNFPMVGA